MKKIGIAIGVAGLALLVGCSTATEDQTPVDPESTEVVVVEPTDVPEVVDEVQPAGADCYLTAACEITNGWDATQWMVLNGALVDTGITAAQAGCLTDATMLRLTPDEYIEAAAVELTESLLANECFPLFN